MRLQTEELAEFLQEFDWSYFLTVTPRRPRRDSIAFIRDVYAVMTAPESRGWSNPDGLYLPHRAFLAAEPFKYQHNLHVHGICHGLSGMYPPVMFQNAFNSYLGRSRVELCRSREQVSSYCAKYVTKLGDGDNYDFYGHWRRQGLTNEGFSARMDI